LDRTKSAAWVVDYVDQHGKRHVKTFTTKKGAEAWNECALRSQAGIHTAASVSKTVEESVAFVACAMRGRQSRIWDPPAAPATPQSSRRAIGRQKLSELTAPAVHAFLDKLRAEGRSLAMRRKVLTNLKTMLTFAQGRGLVAQNVARGAWVKAATFAGHLVSGAFTARRVAG
jgi:integrase